MYSSPRFCVVQTQLHEMQTKMGHLEEELKNEKAASASVSIETGQALSEAAHRSSHMQKELEGAKVKLEQAEVLLCVTSHKTQRDEGPRQGPRGPGGR
eukprot:45194-Eustigmatos_ZCMA.PRE.1